MQTYHTLCGGGMPLNRIVMAGSHDAGINAGKWYARTQSHDIKAQAKAGVRLFDLRIAAATGDGRTGNVKNADLRAYHADGAAKSTETKSRYVAEIGRTVTLDRSSIRMGAFGETLGDMLAQARAFVEKHDTEFLILKFDKCLNWSLVAEACVTLLGDTIYKGKGSINELTLDHRRLKGKVVCAFTSDGLTAIGNAFTPNDGIVGIINLNGGPGYSSRYDGLQYYGKGGTSLMGLRPKTENRKKQSKLMLNGINSDPQAMGMMYWTSTGLMGSIKSRNEGMWKSTQRDSLAHTWNNGLSASIDNQLNGNLNPFSAGGALLKTFMPNIVMIDFADVEKCALIMDLNKVAAHELARVKKGDIELDD